MYEHLCSYENLFLAYKKARKGKTKRRYVKRFEKNLKENLIKLRKELLNQTYKTYKLKTFILRDPKTRKISKSSFRDRIMHHLIILGIGNKFEKSFIFDSHANQIGKGTHKALERFDKFKRKVSKNNTRACFVLKADIKHYFEEVDHKILSNIIQRKIKDEKLIWLIQTILGNYRGGGEAPSTEKGMPLGNLTSQFFANLYLHELDFFVKHKLKAKYYIRYVDDFVILHNSKKQLKKWKKQINEFLKRKLKIELHPNKSRILLLGQGIVFLGFRVFFYHKLIRKSNLINFERKFNQLNILFKEGVISREKAVESLEGWLAYASHANTYKYRRHVIKLFNKLFPSNNIKINNWKKYRNFSVKIKESEFKFSVQKTLFLYRKGFSIKEIAKKRLIKESTVWAHLANLIEHNQLFILEVLSKSKFFKIIYKVYSKKDKLRNIKKRLKDNSITYDEIACVLANIKSK